MTRTKPDVRRAREAYLSGHSAVQEWLAVLPAAAWSEPSVLPGWTVAELAAHVVDDARTVAGLSRAPRGVRARTVAEYLERRAHAAEASGEAARELAASVESPKDLVALHRDNCLAAAGVLDEMGDGDPVVVESDVPIRLSGLLAARAVELAVHGDDLERSVPDVAPLAVPREVIRRAVRTLLDVLAERAPGGAVEVRVPPYAAVQCVGGPRHTRGTPSNVVETDATTWLRLATGRVSWPEALATGALSASGERADLSHQLPLR